MTDASNSMLLMRKDTSNTGEMNESCAYLLVYQLALR